jgi:hypothetical protein
MWTRIKPGTFLLPGFAVTPEGLLAAATAALPAVVSHQAAGERYAMPVPSGLVVVTVPVRSTNRFPDVVVHQSTDLAPDFVTVVNGLPTTTAARTVIDLASVLRRPRLGRVVEHCLISRIVTWNELVGTFRSLARRGKPGVQALRDVLESLGPGLAMAESRLELELIRLLVAAGLPEPQLQYPLPWRTVVAGRIDLAYVSIRVIIEADGRRWHTQLERFEQDRRRDNLATLAGWRVLRFTWEDLTKRPHEIVAQVRAALGLEEQRIGA